MTEKLEKSFRTLNIYERLNKGEHINKSALARQFNVSNKTIQRDIDGLREYLQQYHSDEMETAIQYDKSEGFYYLVRYEREWLTNEEVLAMCKVLLESRAFNKQELDQLISKLLLQVTPQERNEVKKIIQSEWHHYCPLKHNQPLMSFIWKLSSYINCQETITFNYKRQDGKEKLKKVNPVAVMFSEFYFYLIAYGYGDKINDSIVFRLDRMSNIQGIQENFRIPYKDKFSDGEFRKRVQFMYAGKLETITFEFSGPSLEAILDRLPTARVIDEKDGVYTIKAEGYGKGMRMWLGTQGERVKIID